MSDETTPPRVACAMKRDGSHVDLAITIERPLNGFYGCELHYDLDWTPDSKSKADTARLEEDVRKRVAWKVGMETGLPDAWTTKDIDLKVAV